MNLKEFLEKANIKHNFKFNYENCNYVDQKTEVNIICPLHGEFSQRAREHLASKYACKQCALHARVIGRTSTKEEFIEKSREKHGDKYDYSLVNYVNSSTKVKIICQKHGIFEQVANTHCLRGDICPSCSLEERGDRNRTPLEVFMQKSNEIHNYKFDYSLVHDYKRLNEHLTIICPIHGEFKQSGGSHMRGSDCEKCSYEKRGVDYSISKEELLKRFKSFGNGLIYDLSNYKNTNSKISYYCETHGHVTQSAQKHLRGKNCSKCSKKVVWNTSNTEEFVKKALEVHSGFYNYSKSVYERNSKPVIINCKFHGDFIQRPNTHLLGAGCPTCANIFSNANDYIENVEDAKKLPCVFYIVSLKTEDEGFIKIGISRFPNNRFKGIFHDSHKIYKPCPIYLFNTNLFEAAYLENKLFKEYKHLKYKPINYFAGHTECFSLDFPIDEIISNLTSL